MPRIHTVAKARASKKQRTCIGCRATIQPGESFRYADKRHGRLHWCHRCPVRGSQLTSGHRASIMQATEAAEDALPQADDAASVAQVLRDCGEAIREVAEALQESASNMEDGFGHATYMSEQLEERSEALESWADELDSEADDIEGEDEPEVTSDDLPCDECEGEAELHHEQEDGTSDSEPCPACEGTGIDPEAAEQAKSDWLSELQERAEGVLGGCPE